MKLYQLLLAPCLLMVQSNFAIIVSMEAMHHPKLMQSVVLSSDAHYIGDCHQLNDLLNLIRKNTFHFIAESPTNLPEKTNSNQYVPEKVNALLSDPNYLEKTTLLEALTLSIRSEDLPCYFPEFRTGYGKQASIILTTIALDYEKKKEFWSQPNVQEDLYFSFVDARDNALEILRETYKDIDTLKNDTSVSNEIIEALLNEHSNLGNLYNKAFFNDWNAMHPKPFESVKNDIAHTVPNIFNNRYEKAENGKALLKPNNLIKMVDDLSCQLLDLRIIMNILKNKHGKQIIVFAGGAHIDNIARILLILGYISLHKDDADKIAIQKINEARSKIDSQFLQSIDTMLYNTYKDHLTLSIPAFIASCKALENANNPATIEALDHSI